MTDHEKQLLIALIYVVRQYMSERDDTVLADDSADEHVIAALTAFVLMEPVNAVVGRWTPEGKAFLAENTNVPLTTNQATAKFKTGH